MKRLVIFFCVLTIALSPCTLFADEAAAGGTPVQFLKGDNYIDTAGETKEPATVNWVTGKGRKDGVLEWAVDDNYLKKSTGMLGRGFSNAAFGWADVLTHPIRWTRNAPLGLGTLIGVVMGPVVGTLRTTSGVVDIATFWVPFWHGVPLKKPVLGLHDVHNYGTVEDVDQYNHQTKRYFFNSLSDEY